MSPCPHRRITVNGSQIEIQSSMKTITHGIIIDLNPQDVRQNTTNLLARQPCPPVFFRFFSRDFPAFVPATRRDPGRSRRLEHPKSTRVYLARTIQPARLSRAAADGCVGIAPVWHTGTPAIASERALNCAYPAPRPPRRPEDAIIDRQVGSRYATIWLRVSDERARQSSRADRVARPVSRLYRGRACCSSTSWAATTVVPAIFKHHNTYCSYADTIMPQFFFAVGFAYRLTFLRRLASRRFPPPAATVIQAQCRAVPPRLRDLPPRRPASTSWAELEKLGVAGFSRAGLSARALSDARPHRDHVDLDPAGHRGRGRGPGRLHDRLGRASPLALVAVLFRLGLEDARSSTADSSAS